MNSIVFSILLAGTLPAADDQPVFYGTYGSYGTYGQRAGGLPQCGPACGAPVCLPFPYYPFDDSTGITHGQAKKDRETLEKRYTDMKNLLGQCEERLMGLEHKIGTVEILLKATQEDAATKHKNQEGQNNATDERLKNVEKTQTGLLEAMEKNQAKLIAELEQRLRNLEGKQTGALAGVVGTLATKNQIILGLEERLKALEKTVLQVQAGVTTTYEDRIRMLEKALQIQTGMSGTLEDRLKALEKNQYQLQVGMNAKLDESIKALEKSQYQLQLGMNAKIEETIKALGVGNNEQAKALATIMEEKIGVGVIKLEERLKQIETKLLGKAETTPIAFDPMVEMAKVLEQKIALLEQRLKAKYDPLEERMKLHESKTNDPNQKIFKVEINQNTQAPATKDPAPKKATSGIPLNRALVYVSLPPDAKLYIDGYPTATGTNLRSFISPELELNKNYFYTLKVEMMRDGKMLTEIQRVYFQAGREVRVSFDHLAGTAPEQKSLRDN